MLAPACRAQKPTIVALRLTGGRPPLEICLASADEADSWRKGLEGLLATREADARKRELMLELLADGAARKSLKARMTRKERKARESFLRTTGGPRLAMTDLEAALLLQRAMRGHRVRNIVRNWVKITAVDGDVYYCAWREGRSPAERGRAGLRRSHSYPPPPRCHNTQPRRYNLRRQPQDQGVLVGGALGAQAGGRGGSRRQRLYRRSALWAPASGQPRQQQHQQRRAGSRRSRSSSSSSSASASTSGSSSSSNGPMTPGARQAVIRKTRVYKRPVQEERWRKWRLIASSPRGCAPWWRA